MKKLFSVKDSDQLNINKNVTGGNVAKTKLDANIGDDLQETIEEYNCDLSMASEGFKTATADIYNVLSIKESIESKKLATVEYFTSLENYNLYLKSINNNLGITVKIPSMEDFKNSYGTKASHQIAMEGFVDIIKSIWEKIKDFFKLFFKKVMLFFKRLANSDLELSEYEEYIEGLISKVKSSKIHPDSVEIYSKLPMLLGDKDMQSMDSYFLLTTGQRKLENLVNLNKFVFKHAMPNFVNMVNQISKKDLKETLDSVDKTSHSVLSTSVKNVREKYIRAINNFIFKEDISISSLPDAAYDKIISNINIDSDNEKTISIFALRNERDSISSLPQNFNLFLVTGERTVNEHIKTDEVYMLANKEMSNGIKNTINTINDQNNLLKFYVFYKKFSKEFSVKEAADKTDKCQDQLDDMLKEIGKKITNTLTKIEKKPKPKGSITRESNDSSEDAVDYSAIANLIMPADGEQNESTDDDNIMLGDNLLKRKELEELNKFMFSYIKSVQTLIKETTIGLAGTYQVSKLECIKYIYQSASKF